MSYSRWFYSNWYIFWDSVNSGDTVDTQALAIWHICDDRYPCFSYKKLKEIVSTGDLNKTIGELKKLLGLDLPRRDYLELLACIEEFVEDVEKEFKEGEEIK